MKIHTPIFIIGLLVFITPIIGLPQIYEQIILAAYGIAIMVLVSSINVVKNIKQKREHAERNINQTEINHEQERGI